MKSQVFYSEFREKPCWNLKGQETSILSEFREKPCWNLKGQEPSILSQVPGQTLLKIEGQRAKYSIPSSGISPVETWRAKSQVFYPEFRDKPCWNLKGQKPSILSQVPGQALLKLEGLRANYILFTESLTLPSAVKRCEYCK